MINGNGNGNENENWVTLKRRNIFATIIDTPLNDAPTTLVTGLKGI